MAINVGSVGDLATLGLVIDDSGALRAANSLDRLSVAGSRTERVLQKQTAVAQTMTAQHDRGKLAVGRLGNQFGSLAASMSGVHPIMANLLSVFGNFAIGSLLMTGVLGGIAAIIAGWRFLTSLARDARAEADALVKKLLELDKARRPAEMYAEEMRKLKDRLREAKEEAADSFSVFGRLSMILLALGSSTFWKKGPQAWLEELRAMPGQIETAMGERTTQEGERQGEIAKKARALVFEREERLRMAEQERDLVGMTGEALDQQLSRNKALNAELRAREELVGDVLDAEIKAIWAVRAAEVERDRRRRAEKEAEAIRQVKGEMADEAVEKLEAARKYDREMQAIWRQGIGKIVTDGTKSFADFFENVLQMFSKLMARMEAEGKNKGGMYKALGIGSAAIGGGFAGYQIGQQTGSAMLGAFGGAMVGNSLMPGIGGVVGGLAGFATGLLGAASAARQAAREMQLLKESVKMAVLGLKAEVGGNAEKLALEIQQQRSRTAGLANDIAKTGGFNLNAGGVAAFAAGDYSRILADLAKQTGPWARQLEEVLRLSMQIEQQTKERYEREVRQYSEDLRVRLLKAQGNDKEAAALELQLRQERERAELVRSFGDEIDATEAATLALLDQVLAQEKLKAATDAASQSALNMVSGYKLQDVIFDQILGRRPVDPPAPTTPPARPSDTTPSIPLDVPPLEIPVTLTLDGRVIAQTTVRTLQGSAQRQFGDSTRWAEVQHS